jgi:hypothetical protein
MPWPGSAPGNARPPSGELPCWQQTSRPEWSRANNPQMGDDLAAVYVGSVIYSLPQSRDDN